MGGPAHDQDDQEGHIDSTASAGSSAGIGHIDVHFPPWTLHHAAIGAPLRQLHISVGSNTPIPIHFPCSWSVEFTEDILVTHVCCKRGWLSFTWAESDVFIEYSSAFPMLDSVEATALFSVVDAAPLRRKSGRKRALTRTSEIIVGHRSTRAAGVTAFTKAHEDFSRELVAAAVSLVPEAVFNAIALVTHGSTPAHRDVKNDECQEMFLIPRHAIDSWIWVEAAYGSSSIALNGTDVTGAWIPFNRVVCFAGSAAHMIETMTELAGFDDDCGSLSDNLTEERAASSDSGSDAALSGSGAVSETIEVGDSTVPTAAPDPEECEVARQFDLGALSDVLSVCVFKQRVNGTFRKLTVELEAGSTVIQLKLILKKFLHLNVAKLRLSMWNDRTLLDELQDDDDLRATLGPYLLKILPLIDAGQPPVTARQGRVQHVIGAHARRGAIGSSSVPIGANPLTYSRSQTPTPVSSATTPTAIGAPSSNVPSRARQTPGITSDAAASSQATLAQLAANGVTTTPFEKWAASHLIQLEAQQQRIVDLLHSAQHSIPTLLRGSSSARPEDHSAAPWRQGGGRSQSVQLAAVAQSACVYVTEDLGWVPTPDLPHSHW
eukprot:4810713-Amphidinium_carterae.3